MKFVSRRPDDQVNLPSEHPLKEMAQLLLLSALAIGALVLVAGWMVDLAVGWISPETERAVFEPLRPQLVSEMAVGEPLGPDHAVRKLFDRVVAVTPALPFALELRIACNEVPNAMAFPGGLVLVTSGLLDSLDTENELAFVLGHELGHYLGRDHLRGLGRMAVVGLVMQSVWAIGGVDGGDLFDAATEGLLRAHGRDQEIAADRVGAEVLHRMYGHLGGVESLHRTLAAASSEHWSDHLDFTRTHPLSDDRTSALRQLSQERGWSLSGAIRPVSNPWTHGCAP